MALSSRILSRSRQVLIVRSNLIYASQAAFSRDNAITVRTFAKKPEPNERTSLKGDEILKDIFREVKQKYDAAMAVFKREKITIDSKDPNAVIRYFRVMGMVRKEAGLLSDTQKIDYIIKTQTEGIPDARSYLLKLKEIRIKNGLIDQHGLEEEQLKAVDKVEKEIKKPLLRTDVKNMELLLAEFDVITKRIYGVTRKDLPEQDLKFELKVAVKELEELEKDITEAVETQLKREEFKGEKMPDIRTVDIRNAM